MTPRANRRHRKRIDDTASESTTPQANQRHHERINDTASESTTPRANQRHRERINDTASESTTPRANRRDRNRAEPPGSALLFSFLFKLHVSRHKPKEGLAFLGEIYLFYWNPCVTRCFERYDNRDVIPTHPPIPAFLEV